MTFKTIMAAASGGSASDGTIELACRFARRFGAHLEAFHAKPDPRDLFAYSTDAFGNSMSGDFVDRFVKDSDSIAAKTKAAFEATAAKHQIGISAAPSLGLPEKIAASACWREEVGYAATVVSRRARFFDLVVLGRSERVVDQPHTDVVEQTLINSGRPVLVAPAQPNADIGDNVAIGYWRKPRQTEHTFDARLVNPSIGTPQGPWLRTGDLGAFSDGELYIMGRLKDLVVVDGRNHFPDDIEATVREITGGRVAAIAIPKVGTEQLVIIAELKSRCVSRAEAELEFRTAKRDVASVVSATHGLHVADLVGVEPGSIPITSSGKIRRSACVERYLNGQFARSDVAT